MPDTTLSVPLTPRDTPLRPRVPVWRPPGTVVPRWEQHAPAYLNAMRLAVRPGTGWTYLQALTRFIRFLQPRGTPGGMIVTDPLDATRADVEAFLTRERKGRRSHLTGGRAPSTTVTERAALRRFFGWARRDGLRDDDPTDGVAAPRRQPYRDVRALSADEARRLLAAIPRDDVAGQRLHTLAMWFLVTGRRHNEVLRLRWGDVDLEDRTYSYEGKGGKSERRELVPELLTVTAGWHAASAPDPGPETLRFPGRWPDEPVSPQLIRLQFQLVARKAGLGELRRPIHSLRHTNARLRREAGASIEDVQAALDHASLATTAVYLRKLEGTTDPYGASVAAMLAPLPTVDSKNVRLAYRRRPS